MRYLSKFVLFVFVFFLQVIELKAQAINPIIPYTTQEQLYNCESVIDYVEEFKKALECVDTKALKGVSRLTPIMPECYIISVKSPDVQEGKLFNYISFGSIFNDQIVGFYEERVKTIYAIENKDVADTIRHELQHYFLDILYDDGDASHSHQVWKVCEPAYYNSALD